MNAAHMSTIARIRRMMPLNADAMTVCDLAEAGIIAQQAAIRSTKVDTRCAVCEERRTKNAAQTKAARVKKKAAAPASAG